MPLAELSGTCGNVTARPTRRGIVVGNRPVNVPPTRTLLPITDLLLDPQEGPPRLAVSWNSLEVHPNARLHVRRAIADYQGTNWHDWTDDANLTGQPLDASPCDSDELEAGHSFLLRAWAEVPHDLQPPNAPPWLPSPSIEAIADIEAPPPPHLPTLEDLALAWLTSYQYTLTWDPDTPPPEEGEYLAGVWRYKRSATGLWYGPYDLFGSPPPAREDGSAVVTLNSKSYWYWLQVHTELDGWLPSETVDLYYHYQA